MSFFIFLKYFQIYTWKITKKSLGLLPIKDKNQIKDRYSKSCRFLTLPLWSCDVVWRREAVPCIAYHKNCIAYCHTVSLYHCIWLYCHICTAVTLSVTLGTYNFCCITQILKTIYVLKQFLCKTFRILQRLIRSHYSQNNIYGLFFMTNKYLNISDILLDDLNTQKINWFRSSFQVKICSFLDIF